MNESLGKATLELEADGSKLEKGLAGIPAQAREGAAALDRIDASAREGAAGVDRLGDSAREASTDFEKTEGSARELLGTIGKVGGALALGGGIGITAVLDSAEVSAGKLQARMGLTAEEAQKFDAVAKEVYGNNFAESQDQAAQVVADLATAIGLQGDKLKGATEDVFRISDAFEDLGADTRIITEDLRTMKTAWPGKSEAALLDTIAFGFQNGAGQAGDLQDTLQEYSPLFADIGLTSTDMMNFLILGMQNGARNTDVLADAVKEMGIRVQTAGDTGQQAIGKLFPKEEAERLITDFSRGGQAGRDAFFEILNAVQQVEDPQKRYNLLVELFGTKAEDMGGVLDAIIPKFVATKDATNEAKGATERLDAQYAGTGTQVEGLKRKIETWLNDTLGGMGPMIGEAIGGLGSLGLAFSGITKLPLGGIFDKLKGGISGVLGAAGLGGVASKMDDVTAKSGVLSGALTSLGGPIGILKFVGVAAAIGGVTYAIITLAGGVDKLEQSFRDAETAARSYKSATDALKDASLNAQQAEISLEQAEIRLAEARRTVNQLADAGKTKTTDYKQASLDLKQAQLDVAKAEQDVTRTRDTLNQKNQEALTKNRELGTAVDRYKDATDDANSSARIGIERLQGYARATGEATAEAQKDNPLRNYAGALDRIAGAAGLTRGELNGVAGAADNATSAINNIPSYKRVQIDYITTGVGQGLVAGNAEGTRFWRGGITLVGEEGPELVNLPRGSEIIPADETRRMLSGGDRRSAASAAPGGSIVNFNFPNYLGSKDELESWFIQMLARYEQRNGPVSVAR